MKHEEFFPSGRKSDRTRRASTIDTHYLVGNYTFNDIDQLVYGWVYFRSRNGPYGDTLQSLHKYTDVVTHYKLANATLHLKQRADCFVELRIL